ncbi:MAG: hypothetical protein ACUVXI_02520 [bacterium]
MSHHSMILLRALRASRGSVRGATRKLRIATLLKIERCGLKTEG